MDFCDSPILGEDPDFQTEHVGSDGS